MVKGMGDTVDAFITGFKMSSDKNGNAGLIGSLEASFYIQKDDGHLVKHVCAYLPNIPLEMKKNITIDNGDGTYSMVDKMYNMVAEIDGQSISAVSSRLTHPRLIRFRSDKLPADCVYTQEWINSQTDGNLK